MCRVLLVVPGDCQEISDRKNTIRRSGKEHVQLVACWKIVLTSTYSPFNVTFILKYSTRPGQLPFDYKRRTPLRFIERFSNKEISPTLNPLPPRPLPHLPARRFRLHHKIIHFIASGNLKLGIGILFTILQPLLVACDQAGFCSN